MRNKKTGDIIDFDAVLLVKDGKNGEQPAHLEYPSLEAAMEEWEEYEEPKEYWTIDCGTAIKYTWHGNLYDRAAEAVGLKFDTKEECERAIEKMKAWTRLKDKGIKFEYWNIENSDGAYEPGAFFNQDIFSHIDSYKEVPELIKQDLDLLFGGEE